MYVGIDPGPERSALVWFDGERVTAVEPDLANDAVLTRIYESMANCERIAVEGFVPYGSRIGHESIRTIELIGVCVFLGAVKITRKQAMLNLCGVQSAGDAQIRDALIERFGPGKAAAIGKKKTPGPLYGVSNHAWPALAVAVTYYDLDRAEAGHAA